MQMIDQGTCLPLLVWDQYSRVSKRREGGGKSWRWQYGDYRPVTAHITRRSSLGAVDGRLHSVQGALLRLLGVGRNSRKNCQCRLAQKCPLLPDDVSMGDDSFLILNLPFSRVSRLTVGELFLDILPNHSQQSAS